MNAFANRRPTSGESARKERFPARMLPAVLIVYACMLPRELTFEIVGVAFQPFRVVLILLLPYAIYLAAQQRMRPSFVDWLIVFAAIWAFIALWVMESLDAALISGLSEGLNLAFAYFIGRVAIRTSKDLQRFFLAILPGLLVCAAIVAVESLMHQHILPSVRCRSHRISRRRVSL